MTVDSVFTVGHSNRPLEELLSILRAHGIRGVIDVRRFPVSRKWPHFDAAALSKTLPAAGIEYAPFPELGGRRRAKPDSPHTAWKNESFRGYADYMDTPEFDAGLEKAMAVARREPSALMCAEALPWRCHRSLIADALMARGWSVFDILSEKEHRERRRTPFSRFEGSRVVYDGGPLLPLEPGS